MDDDILFQLFIDFKAHFMTLKYAWELTEVTHHRRLNFVFRRFICHLRLNRDSVSSDTQMIAIWPPKTLAITSLQHCVQQALRGVGYHLIVPQPQVVLGFRYSAVIPH